MPQHVDTVVTEETEVRVTSKTVTTTEHKGPGMPDVPEMPETPEERGEPQ